MRQLVPRPLDVVGMQDAYVDVVARRAAGRPYVLVNMVASADGAIAVEGRTEALSSEADRLVFHYLRSLADVILVGAQTVRAERYGPPRIPEERQAERKARGQDAVPRIAVVSGSLDLDWSSRLFTESPTRPFVLAPAKSDPDRLRQAREVADVIVAGEARVDLAAALAMVAEHGMGVALCEGGPTLNGQLAADDLIDELCLTLAPTLVGGDVATGLLGHVRLSDLLPMELVHVLEGDGDLFLRYRRVEGGGRAVAAAERVAPVAGDDEVPTLGDSAAAFDEVVGDLDYPMLIVTAGDAERQSGCLVGFASQCSIDPPRFMVWISKKNHTYHVARSVDFLGVHLPAADQRPLAELFGGETGDQVDKFERCAWHAGPHGVPVLDDVERWFVGRVTETVDSGDHVAFMLAPVDGHVGGWKGQLGFQMVKDLEPGHGA